MMITPATMLGWGTTYHLPIIVGDRLGADLGLPPELIFAGLTILMATTAILSPRVGVLIDRRGPRTFLCAGSVFAAAGLTVMGSASGWVGYFLAWLLFGFAHAGMLGNAALVALARVGGPQARQAIASMMLFTAVNPFLFYPLTAWLADLIGWRSMCLVYAATHILVGMPLLFTAGSLRAAERGSGDDEAASQHDRHGRLPPSERNTALALLMIAFTGNGLIGWGLSPNLVNMFAAFGMATATGVFLASLHGPAQLSGRLIEFSFGKNWSPLTTGVFASALAPAAMMVLMFAGDSFVFAIIGVGFYGMASGFMAVARAAIPLELFGRDTYGAILGRIALPMNLACAIAPIAFASLVARAGPTISLAISAVISVVVFLVLLVLSQRVRNATVGVAAETQRP